jgi:tetratricopeptide (TPR) repeat protein
VLWATPPLVATPAANGFPPTPGNRARWQLFFYTSFVRALTTFLLRKIEQSRLHRLIACLSLLLALGFPACSQQTAGSAPFDALAKQAAEARDADQLDSAVALYKKALALRPKWAEGWWSLGSIEYDRDQYAAAARAFRQLIPLAPNDGTARAMLGLCEFELGQDSQALQHLEEAKPLGVSTNRQLRIVMLYHEGLLLLRSKKFRSAESSFAAVCADSNPGNEVLVGLGLAVFRIPPKEAPPENSPGAEVILHTGTAGCLAAQKKYDQAAHIFHELVTEYPDYPNIHYAYGKFLLDKSDVSGAIEEFKREIERNPADVDSRLEIAAAEYKLDSASGVPYAEEAVRLNPNIPFAHYLLGLLYLDTGDHQKAIPQLETAQKAFPKDAKVYFALGSAYSRAGRRVDAARARAAFERLKNTSADNSDASY